MAYSILDVGVGPTWELHLPHTLEEQFEGWRILDNNSPKRFEVVDGIREREPTCLQT